MLPGGDGADACRRLREQGEDIPVIPADRARRGGGRIIGLEAGADDYVGKPSTRELLARIEAVLRRKRGPSALTKDAPVAFGPFVFDPATRQLSREQVVVKRPAVKSTCSRRWCATPASHCRASAAGAGAR